MSTTNTTSIDYLRLCSECVLEPFLRQKIEKEGTQSTCSYCREDGQTVSINDITDSVENVLEQFYECLESVPTQEHVMIGAIRGHKITQVIDNLVDARVNVAEDIRELLAERHAANPRERNFEGAPFNPNARYARKQTLDAGDLEMSWAVFEYELKTQMRYFSRRAEQLLLSIFEGIEESRAITGRPIVVQVGPEKDFSTLYRARVFQKEKEFREALKRPHVEVGPPPPSAAIPGRMNSAGISVFYGATTPGIAQSEVRPPVGSKVLIGRFEVIRPLRLLDLVALTDLADEKGSLFDNGHLDRLRRAEFLRGLTQRLSKPVMPSDQALEYLPTQAVADFLAAVAEPPFDGILYPSVQYTHVRQRERRYRPFGRHQKYACNVVLFHQAARVELLGEAEELFVSDSSFLFWDSETLEQGPDVEYTAWVPPPDNLETADDTTLRLVSLDARYITATNVEAEPIKTNRFVREKPAPASLSLD